MVLRLQERSGFQLTKRLPCAILLLEAGECKALRHRDRDAITPQKGASLSPADVGRESAHQLEGLVAVTFQRNALP
jgi:hypothetical protein